MSDSTDGTSVRRPPDEADPHSHAPSGHDWEAEARTRIVTSGESAAADAPGSMFGGQPEAGSVAGSASQGANWSPPPATARPPLSGGGTLSPGTVLSSTFEIEHLVARGGMGEVYRARHRITGDPIAIKTIRPELAGDPKIAELFKREAQALRHLRHPAIVSYEGVFDDGTGQLFIAMEYVDGPSLSRLMQNGPLPVADVRRLRERVAGGLAAAHAQGVVHRDLSPDNVILPGGNIDAAKLIDFGIAKQTDGSKGTVIGNDFAGKYSYAAPEQLGLQGGDVGPRADIYSLGLVLAAAATGAPLDMGTALPSAVHARTKVPDLARVPAELRAELSAMLQPDPADRPQSMADLVGIGGAARRTASSAPGKPRTDARSGAGPLIAGIAAAVLVLLGGGGFFLKDKLFPPEPGPSPSTASTTPGGSTPAATPGASTSTPGGITPAAPTSPSAPAAGSPTGTVTATPPSTTASGPAAGTPRAAPTPPATPSPSGTTPAPSTPGPTASATPVPPRPDATSVRSALDAVIAGLECADVAARVDGDLAVYLQGFVKSEPDRASLVTAARGIEGVSRGDAGVAIQPWPWCDLMRLARGVTSPDFRIELNKPGRVYKLKSDVVVFQVSPPAGRQGFLSVAFLNSDDTTWQYGAWSQLAVRPGQPVKLGEGLNLRLAPPAGKMAIIAVISGQPLFGAAPPEEQPTKAYLDSLRGALKRQPDAMVSYVIFDTVN
ncbi:MAG: protein kinase [Alphaproteobacteria bacterium]|nr:protein kinase [Alphaproteobacteria bacterium]